MDSIRTKLKKIKEMRFTPCEQIFYDFIKCMTHRPDPDIKQKEHWFYGHYGHIFEYDKRKNRITVNTHETEWKSFRRNIENILTNKETVIFLEQQIKNYFNCDEVVFFYNTYIEKQREEWNEKWGESYNEVLNR